jgi:hypothetical protein
MLEAVAIPAACYKIGHSSNQQTEYLHKLLTWFSEHAACGETFVLQDMALSIPNQANLLLGLSQVPPFVY